MIATRGQGARVSFASDGATRVTMTVTGPRGVRGSVRGDVPAGTSRLRLTGRLRGRALRPGPSPVASAHRRRQFHLGRVPDPAAGQLTVGQEL